MIDKLHNVNVSYIERIEPVKRILRLSPEEVALKREKEAMNKPPIHPVREVENVYSASGKFKYATNHLIGIA